VRNEPEEVLRGGTRRGGEEMKRTLLYVALTTTFACTSASTMRLSEDILPPKPEDAPIGLYTYDIDRPYEELGMITARGAYDPRIAGTIPAISLDLKMREKLAQEARQLGADAVIKISYTEDSFVGGHSYSGTGSVGTSYHPVIRGIAVRYIAKPVPAPGPEPASLPKPAASSPVVGATLITVREIPVFSGPSSTYDQLGSLEVGCRIEVRERKEGWCRISCKEYSVGWIQATHLIGIRPEPEKPEGVVQPILPIVAAPAVAVPVVTHTDTVTLTNRAPVRSSPGTIYAPIGVIPSGLTLAVLEERNSWYRFSTELFPTGWIEKKYTDRAEPKTYSGGKGR